MQGYDDANTMPAHVWRYLKSVPALQATPVHLLNAGMASYSPSIYVVQAKHLVPKLRPWLVVVDIDETDMGDDNHRYRDLIERDVEGKIIAVHSTAAIRELTERFYAIKTRASRFYVERLARRLRLLGWRMTPRDRDGVVVDALVYMRASDAHAAETYRKEIEFFPSTVAELLDTLVGLLGSADRVLIVHHPHLHQLQPDVDGRVWNRIVSRAIESEATARHVDFFDATADMRRAGRANAQRLYWPHDMHLNFKGLRAYGSSSEQRSDGGCRRRRPRRGGSAAESAERARPADIIPQGVSAPTGHVLTFFSRHRRRSARTRHGAAPAIRVQSSSGIPGPG